MIVLLGNVRFLTFKTINYVYADRNTLEAHDLRPADNNACMSTHRFIMFLSDVGETTKHLYTEINLAPKAYSA